MSYIYFTIICAIWGASFILMNRAVLAMSPVAVGGWRVFGGAVVLLIAIALRRQVLRLSGQQWAAMTVVGLLAYAWPYAIQPYLVGQHDHGFIGMMVALVPLFTILFSIPMLDVLPTRRQIIGVSGGLLCMGAILLDGDRRGIPLLDLVVAVSVPMSYAFGNTLIKRNLKGVAALPLTAITLGVASLALLPLAYLAEPIMSRFSMGPPGSPQQWPIAIAALATLSLLGTGIAMLMFNHLVVKEGPLFAGMVTYIVPMGAVAWSWADDGTVTPLQLGALVGVLAMVCLVQYGAAQPKTSVAPKLSLEAES